MEKCRHCGERKVTRPRGLCWTCYYTPGLRERYGPTSKFGRRGVRDFQSEAPLPSRPTAALPGTEEKIKVLAERASRGEALWHPLDAPAFLPAESGKLAM